MVGTVIHASVLVPEPIVKASSPTARKCSTAMQHTSEAFMNCYILYVFLFYLM